MQEQNKIRLSNDLYLVLDTASLYSSTQNKEVRLTKLPFQIMKYLAENAGRIVSAERIFEVVWGLDVLEYNTNSNYDDPAEQVRKTIYPLRQKIKQLVPDAKEIIKTHSGLGYSIVKYKSNTVDTAEKKHSSDAAHTIKTEIVLDEIIAYINEKKTHAKTDADKLLDDILAFVKQKKHPSSSTSQSVSSSSLSKEEIYAIRIEALLEQINGNYKKAFDLQKSLADINFAPSVNYLGIAYTKALGVEQNIPLGVEYYKKAAELGYASAELNMGDCYMNAFGVECDREKAVEYYIKAATNPAHPDPDAMYRLYMCYKYGKGTQPDMKKAEYWHLKAKENDVTTYVEYYG